MVALDTPLKKTIGAQNVVRSSTRVYGEWNNNRYFERTARNMGGGGTALNGLDEGLFPISSVVEPDRPKEGIVKAFMGNGWTVTNNTGNAGFEASIDDGYLDTHTTARYYPASDDDKYKYWMSANTSAAASPYAIAATAPEVLYGVSVKSNKIVIGIERAYNAFPATFTVQVTLNGTAWNTVSTNTTINSDGRIVLYAQDGTGLSWSTTVNRAHTPSIRGVRLNVTNMNRGSVYLSVIEISARLELDLTSDFKGYSAEYTLSLDQPFVPVGAASSNTGNVSLSNVTGKFTNDNPASPLYNMVDKNALITIDVGIDTSSQGGSGVEWTRTVTMRTDVWTPEGVGDVSVSVKDDSMVLQLIKPPAALFEPLGERYGFSNVTIGEVVWRIMDMVGFSNYNYTISDYLSGIEVDYFWVDGESSVWDIFKDLAESTQTAIYFDRYNVLQIQPTTSLLAIPPATTETPVWDFTSGNVSAEKAGGLIDNLKISDIIEVTNRFDYEGNYADVRYVETKISEDNKRNPKMEVVWEPEDTLVLRGSSLRQSIAANSTYLFIGAKDSESWPYEGVIQLEGEFIKYNGRGYTYRLANGTWASKSIRSNEEKKELDKLNPTLAYQNYSNGRLYVDTNGRGYWGSVAAGHKVDLSDWAGRLRRYPSGSYNSPYDFTLDRENGQMRVVSKSDMDSNSWYTITQGLQASLPPKFYGTRIAFDKGTYTHGAGGLCMGVQGTSEAGYYVELTRTSSMTDSIRAYHHELTLYVRKTDGTLVRHAGKGIAMNVPSEKFFDLEASLDLDASNNVDIKVNVNGVPSLSAKILVADKPSSTIGGRSGVFVRGYTKAKFEYYYTSTDKVPVTFDTADFYDRVQGGYISESMGELVFMSKEFGGLTSLSIVLQRKTRSGTKVFDFGAVVHEARQFDVKFTKYPVVHSRLYLTNDRYVLCPEYVSTPFGAKFILVNASRQNAIVDGEDTMMFGASNPVTQSAMIYGRVINREEAKSHVVKDDQNILIRGEQRIDIEHDWVQTEDAAAAIGTWIVNQWTDGVHEYDLEVFGNPLLNIGDIVTITSKLGDGTSGTPTYVDYDRCYLTEVSERYSSEGFTMTAIARTRRTIDRFVGSRYNDSNG